MQTHSCEDHGHYCKTCEDMELKHARDNHLDKVVEGWNWNASPTDAALQMIQDKLEEYEVEAAMKRRGFSPEQIDIVINAFWALN